MLYSMPKGFRKSWLNHPDIPLLREFYRDPVPLEERKLVDRPLIKCISCDRIQPRRIKNWLEGQRHGFECKGGRNVGKDAQTKTCTICKQEKALIQFRATISTSTGNTLYHPRCYDCIAADAMRRNHAARAANPVRAWLYAAHLRSASRARRQNVPHTLSKKSLERMWTGQCAYCGIALKVDVSTKHATPQSPSLDKVIPSLGYTPQNTVISCYACNTRKSDATPEELRVLTNAVLKIVAERGLEETKDELTEADPPAADDLTK